jgi:hypothetical protein
MEEIDDLRAEVATLRDVATLRQQVLSDCLAEQRRLKRALDIEHNLNIRTLTQMGKLQAEINRLLKSTST